MAFRARAKIKSYFWPDLFARALRILFILFINCLTHFSYAEEQKGGKEQGRIFNEISILSDYIRQGLTQTNHDPAFQTGVGYEFHPQLRVGIWGSNASYENENTHLNFKTYFSYRLLFTQNSTLLVRYDLSNYYKATSRNGPVLSLDLILFSFHILYSKDDNWEGTDTEGSWVGVKKEFDFSAETALSVIVGYSQLDLATIDNYADAEIAYIYKLNPVKISAHLTGTSNSSQFHGRGDFSMSAQISTQF